MNERLPEVLAKFVRKELGLKIPGELSEVIVDHYVGDPDKNLKFYSIARYRNVGGKQINGDLKELTMWKDHPDERLYDEFPYKDNRVKQQKWIVEQLRQDLVEYECFICNETHRVASLKRQKVK